MDIFNVADMVRDKPLGPGEPVRWTFTTTTEQATTNIVQVDGEAGAALRPHRHLAHDEVIYVLTDGSQFRVGDTVQEVRPGDVLHIPAGTLHGPIVPATSQFAVFSVFAPAFDPEHPDRVFAAE